MEGTWTGTYCIHDLEVLNKYNGGISILRHHSAKAHKRYHEFSFPESGSPYEGSRTRDELCSIDICSEALMHDLEEILHMHGLESVKEAGDVWFSGT